MAPGEDDYHGGDYVWRDIMFCPTCDLFIDEEYEYPAGINHPHCLHCGGPTFEIRCLQDYKGEWLPEDQFIDEPYYLFF